MICKNCGSNLKPGVKYCLECGSYVDEEYEENNDNGVGKIGDTPTYKFKTRKRKKKKKTSGVDLLIYGGLGLIIIVCIVIIVMTLTGSSKKEKVEPEETVVKEDKTLTISNYKITVPGEYLYNVENEVLFVSDDVNFTLSYRNTTDDYDAYAKDLKIVTKELEDNKYEVYSSEKKVVSGTEFLCYKLKANGNIKYLYLTKASSRYTSLGVIELFENGDWEAGLEAIVKMNNTISFMSTPGDDDEDEDDSKDRSSTMEETINSSSTVSSSEDAEDASAGLAKVFNSLLENAKKED